MINSKEFATAVAVTVAEDTVHCAWNRVKSYFKDISAKESIRYGTAYEQYVENIKARYSKVKTIIFRSTPKKIYTFYQPMDLHCVRQVKSDAKGHPKS